MKIELVTSPVRQGYNLVHSELNKEKSYELLWLHTPELIITPLLMVLWSQSYPAVHASYKHVNSALKEVKS